MLKTVLITSFFLLGINPLRIEAGTKLDKEGWLRSGKSCVKYFKNGRDKFGCALWQQTVHTMLYGAIGICGYQNGLLEKDDVWPFAVENTRTELRKNKMYFNEKLLTKQFNESYYKLNNASNNMINRYGGCNELLKDQYPSFVRKEAPSKEDIRETMQDTPFQW